ncbi:MAG: DUF4832 domain-containing protein, partial [Desulfobacteraceae bacterium]
MHKIPNRLDVWNDTVARLVKSPLKVFNVITILFVLIFMGSGIAAAGEMVRVHPQEIHDILVNPGMGFSTFQRFNGDALNQGNGWTEGFPIEYQKFNGDLTNSNYPSTSTAYFRIYWRFIEPEKEQYRWDILDKALKTAAERHQTLILRIAPYGKGEDRDVPAWFRTLIGEEKLLQHSSWRVDPENPLYVRYFTQMVRHLGARYDGHPGLEAIDVAIVGFWGEGAGSQLLSHQTRKALVDAYLEAFHKTLLVMLLTDEKTNRYGISQKEVGWRVDCLGDLDLWAEEQNGWSHMYDYYPEGIIKFGMRDAWKKAPVIMELCGTMKAWKDKRRYSAEQVKYIIDQSLKWHLSLLNAKSSSIPKQWLPLVNEWLKRMGYRLVLRSFSYPAVVRPRGKLAYKTWWENKGVAPCYHDYPLALRIKNASHSVVFLTGADIRNWLPGDSIYEDAVFLPADLPEGEYDIEVGILDRRTL